MSGTPYRELRLGNSFAARLPLTGCYTFNDHESHCLRTYGPSWAGDGPGASCANRCGPSGIADGRSAPGRADASGSARAARERGWSGSNSRLTHLQRQCCAARVGSCAGTTLTSMPDTGQLVRSSVRLYYHPEAEQLALRWADRFVLEPAGAISGAGSELTLWAIGDHLELRRPGEKQGLWMRAADLDRRAKGGPELLRACGLSGQVGEFAGVRVLDAMAGWGLDGLLLARMGCTLVMVEKHPADSCAAGRLCTTRQPACCSCLLRRWIRVA